MKWLGSAALLALTGGCGSLSEKQIQQRVQDLASPSLEGRQKAVEALLEAGEPAASELERNKTHPDPEVREQIDRLLNEINRPYLFCEAIFIAPGGRLLEEQAVAFDRQDEVYRDRRGGKSLCTVKLDVGNVRAEEASVSVIGLDGYFLRTAMRPRGPLPEEWIWAFECSWKAVFPRLSRQFVVVVHGRIVAKTDLKYVREEWEHRAQLPPEESFDLWGRRILADADRLEQGGDRLERGSVHRIALQGMPVQDPALREAIARKLTEIR